FEEQDASNFYGRTEDTQALVELLQTPPAHPFVMLTGASGDGKSSLVSAGVIPAMRLEPRWQVAKFRPRLAPFQELTQALTQLLYPALDKAERRVKGNQLADQLLRRELRVVDLVAMLFEDHPDQRLLLIADQFEELSTPTFEQRYAQPIPLDQQHLFLEELA